MQSRVVLLSDRAEPETAVTGWFCLIDVGYATCAEMDGAGLHGQDDRAWMSKSGGRMKGSDISQPTDARCRHELNTNERPFSGNVNLDVSSESCA